VTLQRGHDLPEEQRHPGSVPILGSFGITGWHDELKAHGPGVTIGRSGASFGVASFSPVDYWPLNTALYVIDFHGNDELFVYYFLKQFDFQSYNSGSAQPSLNRNFIHPVPVDIPPLSEQRAIAHILGTLDDKIEQNRKMNETLEAMARALFKSWFVDFEPVRAKMEGRDTGLPEHITDFFPDSFEDSELGNIPKGWEVKQVSELCTLGRGASPRPINDFLNGEVPWIKIADATAAIGPFLFQTKEKLKIEGVSKSVSVSPGDLILSNSATCGMPIFVELHGCIHDGWLYFKNLQSISKLYLYNALIELAEHLIQIADGSVQKNLNIELVGKQLVLVPPGPIRDAFDRQADIFFMRIRESGFESRTLAALRDTLLPKLISGELRVKEMKK
jgi:type I restriction enzyme, S subunit